SEHFDYTAIGESVNMAFRLESLNKQFGTRILASREFLKGVNSPMATRLLGYFRLVGFEKAVEVHEVMVTGSSKFKVQSSKSAASSQALVVSGPAPEVDGEEWLNMFARGVSHFHR